MKAYEVRIGDIVKYDTITHKVKAVNGESVSLIDPITGKEKVISKYDYVLFVERPKVDLGPKIWNVYQVRKTSKNLKLVKGGLSHADAVELQGSLKETEKVKFEVRKATTKRGRYNSKK